MARYAVDIGVGPLSSFIGPPRALPGANGSHLVPHLAVTVATDPTTERPVDDPWAVRLSSARWVLVGRCQRDCDVPMEVPMQ